MADLIFVSTEQFKKLKTDGVGVYIIDNNKCENIIVEGFIIKIYDTMENIKENGENI